MPNKQPNESHDEFMSRCVPMVQKEGTADSPDQAVAICNSMWEDQTSNVSLLRLLTANLSGTVRREKHQGNDYIVAPLVLMREGVLNGSKGPLYYPADELQKDPDTWNDMPIVVYHPKTSDGKSASARQPTIMERYHIGRLYNASYSEGRLVAEAWINVERARQVDQRVLTNIEAGRPIEVSTGLYTVEEPLAGEYNGTPYKAIARNYKPDHLAVLPDQIGACSLEDGCGLLVNSIHDCPDGILTMTAKPITGDNLMAKLNDQKRKELVDNLVGNCECWVEEDREVLNAMTDDELQVLNGVVDKVTYAEAIANAAKKGYEDDTIKVTFDEEKKEFVGNQKTKPNETDTTENKEDKPMTDEQWMASAPPGVRRVVENAQRKEQEEKDGYKKQILANERNTFTDEQLQAMVINQLRGIAALAVEDDKKQGVANYSGAATPFPTSNKEEDEMEPLVVPTMNYKDEKIDKALGRV